jgi:hypothetical protein
MESFDIDIGHGRTLCIEATEKGVEFNSYSNIPSGKVVKVSAKSIFLDVYAWKKFNDNIDQIRESFTNLIESTDTRSEFCLYLGKSIYLTSVSTVNCVNIRRHFFDIKERVHKPGRPGVAFKISEFKELLNSIDSINKVIEIDNITSCCDIDTQSECSTCN